MLGDPLGICFWFCIEKCIQNEVGFANGQCMESSVNKCDVKKQSNRQCFRPQARALVVSGAPDVPETYNSVMNAIFSAQKAGVLVDCAVLGESSTFLQQAAYLTGTTRNYTANIQDLVNRKQRKCGTLYP